VQALARIIRWWLGKLLPGVLVAGLLIGGGACWFYSRDQGDFDTNRRERLQALGVERDHLQQSLTEVRTKMDRISSETVAEQERIQQVDKVIGQLKDLESTWDKLVGNREQQRANAEQLAKMTALRQDAVERRATLLTDFKRATWERDGLEIARGNIESRLQALATEDSKVGHYLRLAWERLKVWVVVWLGLYYFAWPLYRFRRWLHADRD